MSDPSVLGFRLRLALAALISVAALAIGLLGSGGQSPSWAAPNQNPHMQTVPTRLPPTAEPAPTPELTPSPISTRRSPGDDSSKDNTPLVPPPGGEEETMPAQAPEEKRDEGSNEASPTRPPGQDSAKDQTQVPPGESPEERNVRGTGSITPQSADLSLPKTADSARQAGSEAIPFTKAVAPVSAPKPAPESPSDWVGSLGWLCALGFGVILILSGIFLVKRA